MAKAIPRGSGHDRFPFEKYSANYTYKTSQCDVLYEYIYTIIK